MGVNTFISFKTKYGWLTLYATSKGLKEVKFGKVESTDLIVRSKNNLTDRNKLQLLNKVKDDIIKYLNGKRVEFTYPLDTKFTKLQVKLFNALKKHATYGNVISYKELADIVETSPRACGQALGANPLPIIIPCHRVIQKSKGLGGFGGGLRWKKALIKLES